MNTFGLSAAFQSWYGALIMGVLIFLSFYELALMLIRWVFFKRMNVDSQRLVEELTAGLATGNTRLLGQLKEFKQTDAPVKILIGTALSNPHLSQTEQSELFNVTRIRQRERLTKGLSVFGTISTIAPFLGLLGTVLGIVEAFNVLSENGASGPNVLAAGIGAALWGTAFGLFVAIPAVMAYNYFKGKAKDILTDMEVVGRELSILMKMESHGAKLKSLAGK
jgi:biopolymer transport protein ExbB/TolQ